MKRRKANSNHRRKPRRRRRNISSSNNNSSALRVRKRKAAAAEDKAGAEEEVTNLTIAERKEGEEISNEVHYHPFICSLGTMVPIVGIVDVILCGIKNIYTCTNHKA